MGSTFNYLLQFRLQVKIETIRRQLVTLLKISSNRRIGVSVHTAFLIATSTSSVAAHIIGPFPEKFLIPSICGHCILLSA
jgi:hypothetical protein